MRIPSWKRDFGNACYDTIFRVEIYLKFVVFICFPFRNLLVTVDSDKLSEVLKFLMANEINNCQTVI